MENQDPIKVLLVGLGNRGKIWANVCTQTPDVKLIGLVDTDITRAESVATNLENHAVQAYTDLSSALKRLSPEAVIVVTPPATHHSLVCTALEAGKHVLCEKPLSDDIKEVIDLVTRAEASDLQLLVGMNFRYLSTSQRIRNYVKNGNLGTPSYAHFNYERQRDGTRADLNDYPLTMPYPMLFEQSIHHFDLLRYCYKSEVKNLVADSWRPPWSTYRGDCCVSVLFHFENGMRVNYLGTWTAGWNKMEFRWRTDFSSGVLIQRSQFDDLVKIEFQSELGLSGSRFKTEEEAESLTREQLASCVPFKDDSRLLLMEFVSAIHGKQDPVTTGRDHLYSLCLVLACIESATTQSWVNVQAFQKSLGIK